MVYNMVQYYDFSLPYMYKNLRCAHGIFVSECKVCKEIYMPKPKIKFKKDNDISM